MLEKDSPGRERGGDKRAGARNMCANAIKQSCTYLQELQVELIKGPVGEENSNVNTVVSIEG